MDAATVRKQLRLPKEGYLSLNAAGSAPVIAVRALVAACAALSISDSVPHRYRRPNAPKGVTSTSLTLAAFSASLAARMA